ncbi:MULTISPECIES: adenine phosphoribosyltransferase [unclassified Polynucleobacter]|jgi:adenine phosphoribosyltransferase|uniref:adenine phosphoribosyltransferase n=1 Tax=unclassified Polynucleobacter TaxID=2640945 RepID=UPI000BC4E036|nr:MULTISPECIES: adenine phosphoribosyltransferase [unclassified Polynucleobacter]OYY21013.1 MAG: adenine phosphoribosyltransferase [Polynucleobacter sp. 35-46-11]OZA77732.1 MAG: adenine phosphoribosyltransferase [Polynucleobacter sp. 39-46-10]
MNLLDYLPGVPNFPKPGILFRDISPLLASPEAFKEATLQLEALAQQFAYSHILGIESRGFIFGTALARQAHKGLALARKPNKLPLASHRESYGLEYGSDSLEIQQSTLPAGVRVLIVDDVLATGGTIIAARNLLRKAGFEVAGALTLLEIDGLKGGEILSQNGIANKTVLVA